VTTVIPSPSDWFFTPKWTRGRRSRQSPSQPCSAHTHTHTHKKKNQTALALFTFAHVMGFLMLYPLPTKLTITFYLASSKVSW